MSKKIRSTKLVALLLAFFMVLSFVPVSFAATGAVEDHANYELVLPYHVTANRSDVNAEDDLKVSYVAKGVGETPVDEKNIKVKDGVIYVKLSDAMKKASELKLVVDLEDSLLEVIKKMPKYDELTFELQEEIKDSNPKAYNRLYKAEFPVVKTGDGDNVEFSLEKNAKYTAALVSKDLEASDIMKVYVVDKDGNPLKDMAIETAEADKNNDGKYILDSDKGYTVKDSDWNKYPNQKTNELGFIELDIKNEVGQDLVKAYRVDVSQKGGESTVTFTNHYKKVQNLIVLVYTPAAEKFEVEVFQKEAGKAYMASKDAKVEIVRNIGEYNNKAELAKEPEATLTTPLNGKVVFEGVGLSHMMNINHNNGEVFDKALDENILENQVLKYRLNHFVRVSKEGFATVERELTNKEIADGKVQVELHADAKMADLVNRIAGDNRYETAVALAKKAFGEKPEGIKAVILASGQNFADALVANGLTQKYNGPILLTGRDKLPKATFDYIKELSTLKNDNTKELLNPNMKVIIIGGGTAVSGDVQAELLSKLGIDSERLGGKDRFETAEVVYSHIYRDASLQKPVDVLLVNGLGFADSVVASLPAAQYGKPIALTRKDVLSDSAKFIIESLRSNNLLDKVVLVGGEAVLSNKLLEQFNHKKHDRLYGQNRYLTSLDVLKKMYAPVTKVFVASGADYADALTAAKLAAENNAGILLVDPNHVSQEAKDYITKSKITDITIVGGPNAVSEEVRLELTNLLIGK